MRVVFTDDITHHAGGFFVGFVPVVAQLFHGKEHAAVHRFQAVPGIGQCTPYDHAHGVIKIGLAHFVFDADRQDFFGEFTHGSGVPFSVKGLEVAELTISRIAGV